MGLQAVLSDPKVAEAVEKAKSRVAEALSKLQGRVITPQEVYYRFSQTDDFSNIPGVANPGPAAFPQTYATGNNDWHMRSVGDRAMLMVVCGFNQVGTVPTGIAFCNWVQLLLNGNRVREYSGAWLFSSVSGVFLFPDGPILVGPNCDFVMRLNLPVSQNAKTGTDFPIIIMFPLCG